MHRARGFVACVGALLGCAGPSPGAAPPAEELDADVAPPDEGPAPSARVTPAAADAAVVPLPADAAAPDVSARAAADAGAEVASSGPCPAHPDAVCDDFEGPAVGARPAAPWKVSGAGTLVVDDHVARSGKKSVHVRITSSSDNVTMRVVPANRDVLYTRFHVYFPRALPPSISNAQAKQDGTYFHWIVAIASGTYLYDGKSYDVGLHLFEGENQRFLLGSTYGPFGETGHYDSKPPAGQLLFDTAGKWVCFEMMARTSPPETRFWEDGVEHPSLHILNTVVADQFSANPRVVPFAIPKLDRLTFGWPAPRATPGGQPFEFWIDDVGVASERIGCNP